MRNGWPGVGGVADGPSPLLSGGDSPDSRPR